MAIYDIYGNAVSSGESSSSVAIDGTSFLSHGKDVSGNTYSGLSNEFVDLIQSNYNEMMAECLGDFNKIPIIVHTDQHARSTAVIFKLCNDMVDWYEISKIINLGDTVSNTFSETALASYRNNAESYLPLSKRLEVYGNHDIWDSDAEQKYTVNQKRLSPYFYNVDATRYSNNGYFTVIDEYYKVKYLVVNNYEYPDTNSSHRRITTAQADFIIDELSKNDGYDIVLVCHNPLDSNELTTRDATYIAYNELFLSDTTAHNSFMDMLKARKQKTSGTFTDSERATHEYDFTNVSSEILISLHGHAHFEAYRTFEDSITEFIFDWFDGTTFYFGYIDRENMKFKCWKNAGDDLTVEELEIDI